MARIQKRVAKSGATTYVVKWRTPDGKDRTKGGFTTRKAANAYGTKAENASLQGLVFDPSAGKVLFRDAAQLWLASRHDLKPTTKAGHEAALAPASSRRGDCKTLGIDAVFGGYPLNRITRDQISAWVQKMVGAGKKPSTVRHAYFLVRMVLAQAVADGRLAANPADYVKLPSESSANGGAPGVVDDPAQFLTAAQVSALVVATPWPYNVMVHLAAWSGLHAAELAGLQVGDVDLPAPSLNPNAPTKPGVLRVERSARLVGQTMTYLAPKTKGSRRKVPLTAATTALLRDYLAEHPRGDEPSAPLFPAMTLTVAKPTGVRVFDADGKPATHDHRAVARRQAAALAELNVADAAERLVLDWTLPLRHATFYKAIYRPAVLRANKMKPTAKLSPTQSFHSLRHTYASLCAAAGITALEIARFMGHAKVTTTLTVYTHLFGDDHADAMSALGAMETPKAKAGNVIQLHGSPASSDDCRLRSTLITAGRSTAVQ
jgi:integrase